MISFINCVVAFAALAGLSFADPIPSSQVINVTSVEYKGESKTSDPSNIYRDLGYYGQIGNVGIQAYGDTFSCPGGNPNQGCAPIGANSASVSTSNPLEVKNINDAKIWCDYLPSEKAAHSVSDYGMGITNVVATGADKGVIYFAKDWRPGGQSQLQGYGVAVVDTSGSEPTCTRTAEQWWPADSSPGWGDHGAVDGNDGYIYVYGGFNTAPAGYGGAGQPSDVYLARVPKSQATSQNAYQYWNGQSFQSQEIHPSAYDRSARMFTGNMGSIFYSNYYKKWLYLTSGSLAALTIDILTADHPQGPWSNPTTIYDATKVPANKGQTGAYAYAPVAQPQFDSSHQTLIVSYTYTPNQQQVIKINFGQGQQPCNPFTPGGCLPPINQDNGATA